MWAASPNTVDTFFSGFVAGPGRRPPSPGPPKATSLAARRSTSASRRGCSCRRDVPDPPPGNLQQPCSGSGARPQRPHHLCTAQEPARCVAPPRAPPFGKLHARWPPVPVAEGSVQVIANRLPANCGGQRGASRCRKETAITIPAASNSGTRLRVSNEATLGQRGGPPWRSLRPTCRARPTTSCTAKASTSTSDVAVNLSPGHPRRQDRSGQPWMALKPMEIPAGSSTWRRARRSSGKGMPRLAIRARGNHLITIKVQLPTKSAAMNGGCSNNWPDHHPAGASHKRRPVRRPVFGLGNSLASGTEWRWTPRGWMKGGRSSSPKDS